jgi:hypothetical protein
MSQDGFDDDEPYSSGWAYLLWCACLLGACGIHRFYLGKHWTGILYLLTFGCFGVGQVIDLFKMKDLVLLENVKHKQLRQGRDRPLLPPPRQLLLTSGEDADAPSAKEALRMKLLREAERRGGALSVSEGVMASGKTFQQVETALDEMVKSGYVGIDNDPETGVVIYIFEKRSRTS